ncbi:MAG: glycerol transport system ATP-binding protein [Granulosicoccus sp.]
MLNTPQKQKSSQDGIMSLKLENVDQVVNGQNHLTNVNLTLEPGSFNVLLGRTGAGKTSLMRLMAGLDKPTNGKIIMNGANVTGITVQKRNVSMVYQQFINYSNLTVRENIASPLRLAKASEAEINKRVMETADMLRITEFLHRYPLELSGGQQQRTAMARALVKDASLILFDEPLVNLDYKLREELRFELRELFKARNAIAVYATTEPNEALALGGTTTLLHEGRVIQSGPSAAVYREPVDVYAADLFSEPPINLIPGNVTDNEVTFDESVHFPLHQDLKSLTPGGYKFGIRPSHIGLVPDNDDDLELSMKVELAEISGSETFLHVKNDHFNLVMQLSGVHAYRSDATINIYLPVHKLFVFNLDGKMIQSPTRLIRG